MAFENLLRPGRINTMYMRNRLIVGPMEKSLANLDGSLNERYIAYARRRASGGAALIQLESTYVSPEGRGNPFQVGCHGDHVLPALERMSAEIHRHGAKLAMELHHGGRQASITAHHRTPVAPSAIPSTFMDPGTVPRAMNEADIHRVIGDFARAARRCLEAGVDMIHLHGAHGYLLGQFLSPQSNRRTDGYGGSLASRARFPLEVLASVREVVGPDYPIGYRISAVEYVDGGLQAEEATRFAVMLTDAGIDLIDVAGGTYESMSKIFQGPDTPKGGFVAEAALIRRAVGDRVPVSVAQRMNDPVFADRVMGREGFAYVTLARAFHADPDYVRKLGEGRTEEILPCIGCNTCVNLTVARRPAGCAANPSSTFELSRTGWDPARTRLRVLVAGGGIAGLNAARFLGLQGHDVALLEAAGRLGGQLHYLREALPEYGTLVDWLVLELERLGSGWKRIAT
ncbi:MAG: NAD(P)-binding protein [bacterium]|nr:NAD(P)-binding protein [bacterium]